jgi:hypothetical protein
LPSAKIKHITGLPSRRRSQVITVRQQNSLRFSQVGYELGDLVTQKRFTELPTDIKCAQPHVEEAALGSTVVRTSVALIEVIELQQRGVV